MGRTKSTGPNKCGKVPGGTPPNPSILLLVKYKAKKKREAPKCTWKNLMGTVAHSRWITRTKVPEKVSVRHVPREIRRAAADALVTSVAGKSPKEYADMVFELLEALVLRGRLQKHTRSAPDNFLHKDISITTYTCDAGADPITVVKTNVDDLLIKTGGLSFRLGNGVHEFKFSVGSSQLAIRHSSFLNIGAGLLRMHTHRRITDARFVYFVIMVLRCAKVHILDALLTAA